MTFPYLLFIIAFVGALTAFAYLDTRRGIRGDFPLLLRIVVPLLLAGIIVKITQLIGITPKGGVVSYIIGGIGAVIFYIVLISVFKKAEEEKYQKLGIVDYFLGFLAGVIRGWLYFGFFIVYLHAIFGLSFVQPALLNTVIKPVEWLLFLSFF
ncbi:MAG: hypothetical protein A2014_07410 [Spirochaetes bacterium GWF1_49_6]|jgi:uncharacterized membrane protein required for colicin V production|nr:MAG: hypothetical protein A2014_07410 [Spirochaetes bacterium GWF1_49_6]